MSPTPPSPQPSTAPARRSSTAPDPDLRPARRRAAVATALALALAVGVAALAVPPTPAGAAPGRPAPGGQVPDTEDPALEQTIDADQAVASGRVELAEGHVDIGPRLDGDDLTLLLHDDATIPSVWRDLDDVVLRVRDEAIRPVPDDPAYDFLGVPAGTDVHVVPQTEQPGVIWIGWNTQDPALLDRADRGVTLSLLGVQGPGEVTVFLQSGTLGDPEVLWRSTATERQPLWVETNTHTHANWVFTEPGVYLVRLGVEVPLLDGTTRTADATIRLAVGDATDAHDAHEAPFTATTAPPPDPADDASRAEADDGGGGAGPLVAVGIGAAALVVLAAVLVVRAGAARRRAEAARAARTGGGHDGPAEPR